MATSFAKKSDESKRGMLAFCPSLIRQAAPATFSREREKEEIHVLGRQFGLVNSRGSISTIPSVRPVPFGT
jgi:hypothetical protein